jgi:HK97 family phage portal protein
MFDRFLTRLANNYLAKKGNLDFIDFSTWYGQGKIHPTDFDAQIRAFRGTVFACATLNATGVASNPLKLYTTKSAKGKKIKNFPTKAIDKKQKDFMYSHASTAHIVSKAADMEEVVDHPGLELLNSVNSFLNGYDLAELDALFGDLCGNAYWYIVDSGLGTPEQLWVVFPQFMKVKPNPKTFIDGYIYERGAKKIEFEEKEIIHFKHVSPLSEFYGIGSVVGAIEAYNVWMKMSDYEAATFDNMGRPDMAVVAKQRLQPEQEKRLIKTWAQSYGGPKNAGKVAVLTGDLEIKEFGFAPREMSYLEGRREVKLGICNAFGVPYSFLDTDSVNLANAKVGFRQWAKVAILPRCTRRQGKLNEKFWPRYDERLFCAYENPVPEDDELLLKQDEMYLKNGVIAINEKREDLGKEAWEEEFDRPWFPMNMVPSGKSEDEIIEDIAERVALRAREKLERRVY